MRTVMAWLALAALTVSVVPAAETAGDSAATTPAAPTAPPPAPAEPDTSARFRLRVGSRLYEKWSEEHVVARRELFFLGDTDLTASIRRYFRDFKIKDGVPFDAAPEPNNPAVLVVVTRDTTAVDSVWAFRNFPPHYSPRSFFTFQLLDLDSTAAPPSKED
jgi:hypothetical protein